MGCRARGVSRARRPPCRRLREGGSDESAPRRWCSRQASSLVLARPWSIAQKPAPSPLLLPVGQHDLAEDPSSESRRSHLPPRALLRKPHGEPLRHAHHHHGGQGGVLVALTGVSGPSLAGVILAYLGLLRRDGPPHHGRDSLYALAAVVSKPCERMGMRRACPGRVHRPSAPAEC